MLFPSIAPAPLPDHSLLSRYDSGPANDGQTNYTDCFACDIDFRVSFERYVQVFYTTPVFKIERFLLGFLGGYSSTDQDARRLAEGQVERFAAWRVEDRSNDQLLLSDVSGRTRSWLMTEQVETDHGIGTRLLFGSAVLPFQDPKTGLYKRGAMFDSLLGFHRLYSRVLLGAASKRLQKGPGAK